MYCCRVPVVSFAKKLNRFSSSYDNLINVNRNLKVKCVIFDVEVLTGNDDDINSRKKKEIEDKYAATPITSPVYDQSNEIQNVSTIQTKYMNKIRKRIGDKSIVDATSSIKETDATMLNRAKSIPMSSENKNPSRWLLQVGFGDILDYTSFRSINVAVVGRKRTDPNLIDQLSRQLTNQTFYKIHNSVDDRLLDKFQNMEKTLGLLTKEFLLFSSDEEIIEAAKDRGYYTCRYRPPNALFGRCSTDFVATNAIEIQDAIEDLNGIAMRSSAYNSRAMN